MKVKDLINKLSKLDENQEVYIPYPLNDYLRRVEYKKLSSVNELLVSENEHGNKFLINGDLSDHEPTKEIYSLDF